MANGNGSGNGTKPWDDYDSGNTMTMAKAKPKIKSKDKGWPIWSDPKDSKLPPMKRRDYDWGPPYGKGDIE